MHANSPSVVGPGGASNPTTSYFAAQTGQWNSVAIDLDIQKSTDLITASTKISVASRIGRYRRALVAGEQLSALRYLP
jgi:hypothetical protein